MKLLSAALSLLLTTSLLAQKVSNRIQFPQQKIEITVDITSTTDLGMGSLTATGTVDRVFDINSASATGAAIEHKIKRIKAGFNMPGMGNQAFDSEKADDMKGPAGKAMEKMMKNKYAMTLDASGKVQTVKVDDDNAAARNDDPQTAMIISMLSDVVDGLEVPKTGDRSVFAVLPDREVGKGDTWTDSADSRKTTYTLTDMTDTEILISYTETSKTVKEQTMGPVTMKSDLNNTTEGTIVLDRKTGVLKKKIATINSEGTMEAMGQQGPVSSKISKTWTVK